MGLTVTKIDDQWLEENTFFAQNCNRLFCVINVSISQKYFMKMTAEYILKYREVII